MHLIIINNEFTPKFFSHITKFLIFEEYSKLFEDTKINAIGYKTIKLEVLQDVNKLVPFYSKIFLLFINEFLIDEMPIAIIKD